MDHKTSANEKGFASTPGPIDFPCSVLSKRQVFSRLPEGRGRRMPEAVTPEEKESDNAFCSRVMLAM